MSLVVNVQGGTGAGKKRPKNDPWPDVWTCVCGAVNKPYHTRCHKPGCNKRR